MEVSNEAINITLSSSNSTLTSLNSTLTSLNNTLSFGNILGNATPLQKLCFTMPICLLILSLFLLFSVFYRSKVWIYVWGVYVAVSLITFLVSLVSFFANRGIDLSDQVSLAATSILFMELLICLIHLCFYPNVVGGGKLETFFGIIAGSLFFGFIFWIIHMAIIFIFYPEISLIETTTAWQFLYANFCFVILFKTVGGMLAMKDLSSTETEQQEDATGSYKPVNTSPI